MTPRTDGPQWPRTLADDPGLMHQLSASRHRAVIARQAHGVTLPDDFDPACRHTLVVAPCCGRYVCADTIISTHGLTTEVCGGNYRPKANLDWLCTDACLHILITDTSNGWTRSKLFRALGAPADVIRHERAREIEWEERRAADAKGEPFKPQESYERAHASLPANVRELPGTEPPNA